MVQKTTGFFFVNEPKFVEKKLYVNRFCGHIKYMANILAKEKQIAVISALAEGNSIRSIERMTEIHRDTMMRLGVRVGEACQQILDQKKRRLNRSFIEVDELWGFIGKKEIAPSPQRAFKIAIAAKARK